MNNKRIPAMFNWKDLCPEFDFLFENGRCVEHGNQVLGFLNDNNNTPAILTWDGNEVTVRLADSSRFNKEDTPAFFDGYLTKELTQGLPEDMIVEYERIDYDLRYPIIGKWRYYWKEDVNG